MLTLSHISKQFASGDGVVKAVNDISFSVEDGTFAAIVGKSGSGKSSLLNLLGTLDAPSEGEIKLDDQVVSQFRGKQLTVYRRQKIGFIFQNYQLIPNLTALENVMLPMEFTHVSKAERKSRAQELLNLVGLDEPKQGRRPSRLSGGEQQRVAIARALANRPRLILADEPTGNLDSKTGKIIIDLLRDLARSQNATVVAVTHDQEIAKQADVMFTLQDGELVKSK